MKMTKLLGAVLGVVMVAILFVGAGAAATDDDLGTYYTYVLYDHIGDLKLLPGSVNLTWENSDGKGTVTFIADPKNPNAFYVPAGSEGKYYFLDGNKRYIIHISYPTVQISGTIYNDKADPLANLIDNTIGTNECAFFNPLSPLPLTEVVPTLVLMNPEGSLISKPETFFGPAKDIGKGIYAYSMKTADLGKWKVFAKFEKGTTGEVGTLSTIAPSYFFGDQYSFDITSSDTSKTLSCNSENITQGGYATIKLQAPYGDWIVSTDVPAGHIPPDQPGVIPLYKLDTDHKEYAQVHVDTSGMQTFVVQSNSTDDVKVTLYKKGSTTDVYKEITIRVIAGTITADFDKDKGQKDSVYIGDDFDLKGTNDLNGNLYFFITGTNYPLQPIYESKDDNLPLMASGKEWTATINTGDITSRNGKSPDAGTYTIYVAKLVGNDPGLIDDTDDFDNSQLVSGYTTISVPFIQPFIKANAPDVVVQGDKLEISGTAEGNPSSVRLYVFGTNFFNGAEISVLDDGTFSFSKKIVEPNVGSDDDWGMATGQYFAVVQHPMYDKLFNIAPLKVKATHNIYESPDFKMGADIVLFKSKMQEGQVLFNTATRQSANAAQALIDAMSSQDIDDMQSHFSFVVAGPTSYVNAIPDKITKGQTLTISGTTTGHKNDIVSVELLSTAFAAVPKETVGSASFSTLTTRIGDNGVWSISFDTSNMNADEYTVSIAVGSLDATTAKVQIVDGPVPTPTQTPGPKPTSSGQPTVAPTSQPTTTPQTPGFGALASLVGLGAVAVLLLRRE